MRPADVVLVMAFSVMPLACFAQPQAKPSTLGPYGNESIVIERSETTYRMHADGTGERDLHVILRIQSDGAAQQFGVLAYAYASANETPVIKFLRVHKADGTTVDTPVTDAMDMPADVTRQAPLYSDLKEKHIPVRSLSSGDKLEYEVDTTINKPETPEQFWGTYHFTPPGTVVVLAEVLTFEVPSDKYVQVWSPNHEPATTDHDGLRTYRWNVAQLATAPKRTGDDSAKPTLPRDPDEDADGRKLPSVAWTTFHSWTEVGDWYRSLALKQAEPNDMLRTRAAEIANKANTPEEQVRAIYDFVSTRIHYVGIDFGVGRYQPHAASEVLADQYGDCKDKDTLLESLLRARGFSTAPALVGAGIAPVPDIPSPAMFNHVITTVNLPGGRIWLDSTPMAAPYQYLSAVIRDQKALVVPADGSATLEATPPDGPYRFTARFEATGSLDAEGKMTAKMSATYRNDEEIVVRALARSVAPAEWDKVSQYLSATSGFSGTTSNTQFKNDVDSSEPIVMTYDYSRHPFGDWDNLRIVPLFPALEFSALDSDTTAPQEDIQLGSPRTLTAISHIRLPDGYRTDLPDPIHVKADFATFDKTYRFEGNEIIAERNIVVLKRKIPKADWKQYQSFIKDISLSGESWIQLFAPAKTQAHQEAELAAPAATAGSDKGAPTLRVRPQPLPGFQPSSPPASATPPADASAAELMKMANEKLRSQDWDGAEQLLNQVKAKNPKEENLWATYGFIAEAEDRDYDVAAADFRKELSLYPDNANIVYMLADAQTRGRDSAGARRTLQ